MENKKVENTTLQVTFELVETLQVLERFEACWC
jgi:hypothetical protein